MRHIAARVWLLKTNQENLFIEASKDLLLANGVSENKVEQLVKQDKSKMVKMASGESISIGDCGTNSSDQDSCGMDGFTAEFSIFTPIPNAKIVNITLD